MARIIGTAGESAAARGLIILVVVSVPLVLIVIPYSIALLVVSGERWGIVGICVAAIGLSAGLIWQRDTFAEAREMLREGGNFLKGARGEVLVHQELRDLTDEYIVFHDFHPIDSATGKSVRWNVDHIVVGPTGVFVLDAKCYRRADVAAARHSKYSARHVRQVQHNAMDLKDGLVRWSAGELAQLFVVPVVVYTQPNAKLESLREGHVRTLPLRMLLGEITSHAETAIDQEKAGRIARVLFMQIAGDLQRAFKPEFDAYGELSKAARYAARDTRLAAQAGRAEGMAQEASEAREVGGDAAPQVQTPSICPRCGAKLVRRVAKHGERAGRPFLSCEDYSRTGCRYGFNLEE